MVLHGYLTVYLASHYNFLWLVFYCSIAVQWTSIHMFPLWVVAYQPYPVCLRSSACGRAVCRDMCLTSYTPQKIDMNLLSTAAQILAICTKGPCKRRGGNQRRLPSGYWQPFSHCRSHNFSLAISGSPPILFFSLKDYLTWVLWRFLYQALQSGRKMANRR